jgi:hypothetical protein
LLQYILFPKKNIDWSNSIVKNNINIDSRKNISNFQIFLELLNLKIS